MKALRKNLGKNVKKWGLAPFSTFSIICPIFLI